MFASPSTPLARLGWMSLRCLLTTGAVVGVVLLLGFGLPWVSMGTGLVGVTDGLNHAVAQLLAPVARGVVSGLDGALNLILLHRWPVFSGWLILELSLVCLWIKLSTDGAALGEDFAHRWLGRVSWGLVAGFAVGYFTLIAGAASSTDSSAAPYLNSFRLQVQLQALDVTEPQRDFEAQVASANAHIMDFGRQPNGQRLMDAIAPLRVVDPLQRIVATQVNVNWATCRGLATTQPDGLVPVAVNGKPVTTPASILAACDRVLQANQIDLQAHHAHWH